MRAVSVASGWCAADAGPRSMGALAWVEEQERASPRRRSESTLFADGSPRSLPSGLGLHNDDQSGLSLNGVPASTRTKWMRTALQCVASSSSSSARSRFVTLGLPLSFLLQRCPRDPRRALQPLPLRRSHRASSLFLTQLACRASSRSSLSLSLPLIRPFSYFAG